MTDERKLVERLHDMITDCDGSPIDDEELVRVTPHVGVVREIADLIERNATERATIRREARRRGLIMAHDALVAVPAASIEQEQAIQRCQTAIRAIMEDQSND